MDGENGIQGNGTGIDHMYGTRHYLVSHLEMRAIIESLERQATWDIYNTQGLKSVSISLGKGQWMRFSFFKINKEEQYIMEGEGSLPTEKKWLSSIPSAIRKVMAARKPINYSKFTNGWQQNES